MCVCGGEGRISLSFKGPNDKIPEKQTRAIRHVVTSVLSVNQILVGTSLPPVHDVITGLMPVLSIKQIERQWDDTCVTKSSVV